ncbi:calmodulin-like protein 5 isoform X1 [Rousettus aegyptiacus]|uniref:calmodulin-like protein 5 isoform X1 n=2 Tax=Rousettus aegyptiacus TaxID=9407 RepID=UPI00168D79D6|nr:calmodulin-like protein 5 isoform X1 [Rousettus aegyptiacus]
MGWVGSRPPPCAPTAEKEGSPPRGKAGPGALAPSVAASSQLCREHSAPARGGTMAGKLSKAQEAEFKSVFTRFDTDGDGAIDLQELGDAMRALGQDPTEAELKEIIARVDADGDGAISLQEFLAEMARKVKAGLSEGDMRAVFRAFDMDGDGYISVDELKQAMAQVGEKLSQEDVEAMIREADVDQDGQVNYEEFTRILAR